MGGFLKCVAGRVAVDGVYHHLLWANLLKRFYPGRYVTVGRVVEVLAADVGSLHEHSLDDDVAVERSESADDVFNVVCWRRRTVHAADVVDVHGVELQDVVVHALQGAMDGRQMRLTSFFGLSGSISHTLLNFALYINNIHI